MRHTGEGEARRASEIMIMVKGWENMHTRRVKEKNTGGCVSGVKNLLGWKWDSSISQPSYK